MTTNVCVYIYIYIYINRPKATGIYKDKIRLAFGDNTKPHHHYHILTSTTTTTTKVLSCIVVISILFLSPFL